MAGNKRGIINIPDREVILENLIYDSERYMFISKRTGKELKDKRNGYLSIAINGKRYYTHRVIFFLETGKKDIIIDHIDGNILNNNILNLRESNKSLNSANKPKYLKNATSKYKGVYKPSGKKKWGSKIKVMGKNISLGSFDLEEDAAKAYNEAAIKYFGEHAYLNIIEEDL